MFTLIKRIQEFISNLKKNKGLWFTTITTVSIIGIAICLTIIMTMTSGVSQKVYKSMAKTYELDIKSKIDNKRDEFQKMGIAIQQSGELVTALLNFDAAAIAGYKAKLNDALLQNGYTNFEVDIINTNTPEKNYRNIVNSVINTKKSFFGAEVLNTDIFYLFLEPLFSGDTVVGVVEIKESIHNLKTTFKNENKEFVFLLDKKMLPYLLPEAKSGFLKDVSQVYTIDQRRYDSKFALDISDMNEEDFVELFNKKYIIQGNFFRTVTKISDVNGVDIGIVIAGESTEEAGAFVNIADSMTNTVTTVALGLIISLILFLF